ncbi:amidase signature domain-containing protein [Gymnopilus junonius]|uniref:Amidase signature domain-containing protein n=1 Tax=Gymnopilus junonius TaxID=109634 RepID=A0A9P5NX96_GYMJU|nr:amidase signature domain-containing protein [Gymnopilus junonius]
MSVVSLAIREGNPVTEDTVRLYAKKITTGMELKNDQDVRDLASVLAAFHDSVQSILEMEDYVPSALRPDFECFPRKNITFPEKKSQENPFNGWACKFTLKDKERTLQTGLLVGKTVVLKDNVCIAGVPCGLGTDAISPPWVPNIDATVVKRILEAGGIIVGKASTESMCQSGSSFTSNTGPVDNPYAPGRTSGGSSSGCAVLVADGSCDMAIGADQGGSIRMPCAFCGLVGIKPMFGLVPYTGISSNEWQHDYAGPMCKSVYDTALLLQAISGADGLDDRAGPHCPLRDQVPKYSELLVLQGTDPEKPLKGKKVGILKEAFSMPALDPRMAEKCSPAHHRANYLDGGQPLHRGRTRLGQDAGHRQYYNNDLHDLTFPLTQERWEKLSPFTINSQLNALYGWERLSRGYGKAMNKAMEIRHAMMPPLKTMTVSYFLLLLLLPIRTRSGRYNYSEIQKSVGQGLNCSPFNSTGHPALSLLIGTLAPAPEDWVTETDAELKLPVAMQLVGKWWDETVLLQLASAWEKAYDWRGR